MKTFWVLLVFTLSALLFASANLLGLSMKSSEPPLATFGKAPNFNAISAEGSPFNSESLEGRVWVATFFFTSCRGPCPIQSAHLAKLNTYFAEENEVSFVSISVDPQKDSVERLAEYAARYLADPKRWHFLNMPETEVMRVLNEEGFKLGSAEEPAFHSTRFVLVDRSGNIRGFYRGTDADSVEELRGHIDLLLQENV